jgi:hypothetical protein
VRTAKQRARATTTKAKKAAKPAKDSPATLEGFNMGTNKRRRKMRELLNKVAYSPRDAPHSRPCAHAEDLLA